MSAISLEDLPVLSCFELPVYVKRAEVAAELLSGGRKINDTILHPEHRADLHLRPADPLSHPLSGDRHSTNNFLVTVKRTPSASSAGGASSELTVSAEIRGHISTTYRWDSLADFQYVSSGLPSSIDGRFVHSFLASVVRDVPADVHTLDALELAQASVSAAAALSGAAAPFPWVQTLNACLNLSPLVFSHVDKPLCYAFRRGPGHGGKGGPGRDTAGAGEGVVSASSAGNDHRSVFSLIHSHHVLTEGTPVPCHARSVPPYSMSIPAGEALAAALKEAFESRPVWTLVALSMHVGRPSKDFRFQMPAFAYFMRGGTYRNCWAALGWDPRTCPAVARLYQAVDVKIPPTHSARVPSTLQVERVRRGGGVGVGGSGYKAGGEADGDESGGEGEEEDVLAASGSGAAAPAASLSWSRWGGSVIVRRSLFQIIDLLSEGVLEWGGAGKDSLGRPGAGAGSAHDAAFASAPAVPTSVVVVGRGTSCTEPYNARCVPLLNDLLPLATTWSGSTGWIPKPALDRLRKAVTARVCAHIDVHAPTNVNTELTLAALLGGHGVGGGTAHRGGTGRGRGRGRGGASRTASGAHDSARPAKKSKMSEDPGGIDLVASVHLDAVPLS